jgi:hypothetical protein
MWLFVHVGVIAMVASYYTLGAAIAPRLTERARDRFARKPWLPIVVGVGISIPWVAISIVLLNTPVQFAGAVGLGLWVLFGLVGGAGIAQHVGVAASGEDATWRHTLRGGLIISLTWVLPIVGWLFMLPVTLAAGVGCLSMSLIPTRRPAVSAPPIVPQT